MSPRPEPPTSACAASRERSTGARPEPLLARHRDVLKQRFPLPDADAQRPARTARTVATALALVGVLLGGLYLGDPGWQQADYHTGSGGRRSITLGDGSRLTLDASSQVRVHTHLRTRRVELLAGRARFEVTHSRWRVFQVDAGPVQVRNYGTVFDVARQGTSSAVALWQGQVGVTVAGVDGERRLRPGQQLLAGPGQLPVPRSTTAGQAAWTQGQLSFVRAPLDEVVRELQRYHRGRIVLADPGLAALQVSGVFDSARSDAVLALLPDILPVQVLPQDDGSVRIHAR